LLLAAVAAILTGGLALPAAAGQASSVGTTPEAAFHAQATAAGLDPHQEQLLQATVARVIARTSGTQVAANRVLWPGGTGDTLIPLPGEERARDLGADARPGTVEPADHVTTYNCRYLEFCLYANRDFTGMVDRMWRCIPYDTRYLWFTSYVNNQTPYTRAEFLYFDKTTHVAWTKPAYNRGTTSLASDTYYVKPC